MARRLHTGVIGVAIGRKCGRTQAGMLELVATTSPSDPRLDEKAIGRVVAGKSNQQSKTRLQMIPISAEILGLPRDAIVRELFWRETYEQLSEELANGGAPIMLEGFLLLLRELLEGDGAGSAWNYATAPYMEADLQWDAMSRAMTCLGGRTRREVRQSCVLTFKRALDRFEQFAHRIRSGVYQVAEGAAAFIAARADSMRAVCSEQLFSLALLNEENGWGLARDEAGHPLTLRWAAALLPSEAELAQFTVTLLEFLPGPGWQRRISNNHAVLSLAITSAAAAGLTSDGTPQDHARLKRVVSEAVAELLRPCDGGRVRVRELPTYRSLQSLGIIEAVAAPLPKPVASAVSCAALAVLLTGLAFAGIERIAEASNWHTASASSQAVAQPIDTGHLLYLAGPGGTGLTVVAAIGPGGTVVTRMEA
ncbi:hypothetical protein [Mesorhizobium sp. 2RAF21]|uniref:hypothetical protein n=1 Tax=Mesorhizobium sp. 2RAF21 TaxID=3232995 RepID=UPI003F986D93